MSVEFAHVGRVISTVVVLLLAPMAGLTQTSVQEPGFIKRFSSEVLADFRFHYSLRPLTRVALGFGVAGVLANSNADKETQQFFRDKLTGKAGDDLANLFTGVGDVAQPLYSFPIYLGAMWFGGYSSVSESSVALWGANSLRAALVAAPELVALSYITGGHRPEQGEPGWYPFDDDNGASGHAYFGAVPLISAAKLANRRWIKYSLYASSALPGLARVYEDKHYFSQSLLGWWLAYLANETIEHTNRDEQSRLRFVPVSYLDGDGVQVTVSF